jgi:hypothetical protein
LRSRGVRGTARKKSGDTFLAEERSRETGREGYARERERRKTWRELNCRFEGILTETASLTLGLEQAENVVNLDCWAKLR